MTTTDERATVPTTAPATAATVRVRAFAAARAALGWSERDHETGPATTVGTLVADLLAETPAAADVVARCSVLVDGVRTDLDAPVPAGAVVDLLPPFAGG
ncbi:MoaD/ThiS family protein [Luteimicrobium sp. NPDC057192]|uniref:MoaD/ThiS family protein n=1 Tax=Luteimicrobium sp. NPDC057192 TaxID=3346042 RepID=UPI00363D7AFF